VPGGAPKFQGLDWFAGGPIGWYLLIVFSLTVLLAAFVAVDSLRPGRRARLAELREPSWTYTGIEAVFLALALFGWLPFLPRWVAAVTVLMVPFALGFSVAYLLRVVFPKPVVDAAPVPENENATPVR
jgi:hypothetical protein